MPHFRARLFRAIARLNHQQSLGWWKPRVIAGGQAPVAGTSTCRFRRPSTERPFPSSGSGRRGRVGPIATVSRAAGSRQRACVRPGTRQGARSRGGRMQGARSRGGRNREQMNQGGTNRDASRPGTGRRNAPPNIAGSVGGRTIWPRGRRVWRRYSRLHDGAASASPDALAGG